MHKSSSASEFKDLARRISFLDGCRGLAILAVISFHYYSRFAGDVRGMYPFGAVWSDVTVFKYGFFGVELFFAVSGFVIALTLNRCDSFLDFGARRLARLWPTMLLCSVITYVFLKVFPIFWSSSALNFLPSLTFMDGGIFERLIPGKSFQWMDGVYWSLFVEVRFYFIAGVLFFLNRKEFHKNLVVFSLTAVSIYLALSILDAEALGKIANIFLIPTYWQWFLLGVSANYLWRGEKLKAGVVAVCAVAIAIALAAVLTRDWAGLLVAVGITSLFLACYYSSLVDRIVGCKLLATIGVSSYSLYLLHQYIGVTLTAIIADHFDVGASSSIWIPVGTAALLVVVANLIYFYWEAPMNRILVRNFSGCRTGFSSRSKLSRDAPPSV